MAHSSLRLSLDFTEFTDLLERLEKVQGNLKEVAEETLSKSFDVITPKIKLAIQDNNLPAQGKYSKQHTKKSLIENKKITWERTTASIDVGFDFKKSGLVSIYLMYGTKVHGTPRMAPAKGLKKAILDIYDDEIQRIEKEVLQKAINKAVTGHE